NIVTSSYTNDTFPLLSLLEKETDQTVIEIITVNILKSKVQQILANPAEYSAPFEYILTIFKNLTTTPNYYPTFITALSSITNYMSCQVIFLFYSPNILLDFNIILL